MRWVAMVRTHEGEVVSLGKIPPGKPRKANKNEIDEKG